jgi:hypothetical protein
MARLLTILQFPHSFVTESYVGMSEHDSKPDADGNRHFGLIFLKEKKLFIRVLDFVKTHSWSVGYGKAKPALVAAIGSTGNDKQIKFFAWLVRGKRAISVPANHLASVVGRQDDPATAAACAAVMKANKAALSAPPANQEAQEAPERRSKRSPSKPQSKTAAKTKRAAKMPSSCKRKRKRSPTPSEEESGAEGEGGTVSEEGGAGGQEQKERTPTKNTASVSTQTPTKGGQAGGAPGYRGGYSIVPVIACVRVC